MQEYNTLVDVMENCISRGGETGITFIAGDSVETFISYQLFYQQALGFLHHLQAKGLKKGDELVLQLENNQTFLSAYWACLLGGIIPIPVTPGNTEEQRHKLTKIWSMLNNPALIAGKDIWKTPDNIPVEMKNRIILAEEFIDAGLSVPGKVHKPRPSDIAFVQFSSGSTGDPKGVILTHQNLLTNISAISRRSKIHVGDSMLSWMPLTHDMGLISVHLTAFTNTIHQYLMPTSLFIRRPALWLKKTSEHKATIISSPNFGYKYFLSFYKPEIAESWDLSSVRIIYNGAEPVSTELCHEFMQTMAVSGLKSSTMCTGYGLAEASVDVTVCPPGEGITVFNLDREHLNTGEKVAIVDKADARCLSLVDVGAPVDGCRVQISDDDGCPLAEDTIGHIRIRGGNVTAGYYNNPAATEKTIAPDGWLDTGDLGFMHTGRLVVTGRAKDIIFINGLNYYPHDIERVAEGVEGIELGKIAACGTAVKGGGSEEILLFVLFKKSTHAFVPLVKNLQERIDAQMGLTVKAVIPVKSLPKSTSGKIRRYQLGEMYRQGFFSPVLQELDILLAETRQNRDYVPPSNELEKNLVKIFEETTGIRPIGIHDSFYAIGLQSVTLLQLIDKIGSQWQKEIKISDFIRLAHIAGLASFLAAGQEKEHTIFYEKKRGDLANLSAPFPLTEIQRAYLSGRETSYELGGISTHVYFELETTLDLAKLETALQKVIRSQPMLRAVILKNGQQQILPKVGDYSIPVTDLSRLESDGRRQSILDERSRMSHEVFDPYRWPLFKIKAAKVSEYNHILFISLDLTITDGYSIFLLGKEWLHFYYHPDDPLPLPDFTFRDYVLASNELKNTPFYQQDQHYWQEKLEDFPAAPDLPLLKDPEKVQTPYFKRLDYLFQPEEWQRLKHLAQKHRITPSALLCTAYAEVLACGINQSHLAINMTAFNRYPFHENINRMIGDFTSVLLLDIRLKNRNFWENAETVQKTIFLALEHRHYEGVKFLRDIARQRHCITKAFFPVVFTSMVFETIGKSWFEMGKMQWGISQTSQVYLDCQVIEADGSLRIQWDYVEELFDPETIRSLFTRYIRFLEELMRGAEGVKRKPGDNRLFREYNRTEEAIPAVTLHGLFAEQAVQHPDSIAVMFEDQKITYGELHQKSNQTARFLIAQGFTRTYRIGVAAHRCLETIINILGILKAGAAYVPVDPEYPQERREYIIRHSRCSLVLTPDFYAENELYRLSSEDLPEPDHPEDAAYIIYTSGSTGQPKGVVITHCAAGNTVIDINRKCRVTGKDRIIGLSSLCFDLSVYDVFGALSTGAGLVLIRDHRDAKLLANVVDEFGITFWNSVPALMDMLVQNLTTTYVNSHLRSVLLSGDWIPLNLPAKIRKHFPQAEMISLGGATEASIWSIYYPFKEVKPEWKSIPYGKPLANQQFYVLNDTLDQCPAGTAGELYIGGAGLAQGYFDDAEKTKADFIRHPEFGNLYRTGDFGVMHQEGYIEFLGRKDHQVKIRGYRIELGEIENCLLAVAGVKNAVVIDHTGTDGKKSLCAYVVCEDETPADFFTAGLKEQLASRLPDYMIPSYFMVLANIPLTPNGKVDRKALPEPELTAAAGRPTAPQTLIEKQLSRIWTEVLEINQIGIHDNFFERGGDSLSAQLLANQLEKHFNVDFPVRQLFIKPTIAGQGRYLEDQLALVPAGKNDSAAGQADVSETIDATNENNPPSLLSPKMVFSTQADLFTGRYGDALLYNKAAYHNFKNGQLNRKVTVQAEEIPLKQDPAFLAPLAKRRSLRVFDESTAIPFERFSQLLSVFRQFREQEKIRYYYASAGGLYPVDVYVYVKSSRVGQLQEGIYYYNPVAHSLTRVSEDSISGDLHYFKNKAIFKTSAFSVFLIYNAEANMPIYGSMGYFYACIDTGIMTGLLTQAAERLNIGLCSIGDMDFEKLRGRFCLNDRQVFLHAIEGGIPLVKAEGDNSGSGWEDNPCEEPAALYYPALASQKRLYAFEQMNPEEKVYNNPVAIMLEGRLDAGKLQTVISELIARHDAMRTSLEIQEGELVQRIHAHVNFNLEYTQCAEGHQVEMAAERWLKKNYLPFDLGKPPLFKAALLRLEAEKHLLFMDMHHIVADRTSQGILEKEIAALYAGEKLPPLPVHYRDFCLRQKALLETSAIKKQEQYWQERFNGEIPVLAMPTDYPRPALQNFAGGRIIFKIGSVLTRKLINLAMKTETTLYMVLLSVYTLLLSRYTGQEDIVVGSPVAGRSQADFENTIGMFVNTLAMRNFPQAVKRYRDFLREVKENALQAFDNQDYPLDALMEKRLPVRDVSRNPLFDTLFVLQNTGQLGLKLASLHCTPYPFTTGTVKFDLTLIAEETATGIDCCWEYSTHLYTEDTIQRLSGHFVNLLNAVTDHPGRMLGQLKMLMEAEKKQILFEFNPVGKKYTAGQTLHGLFALQAGKTPDRTAVMFEDRQWRYRELDLKADQAANLLRQKGIQRGQIVGLLMGRSLELTAGLLGILKAGAAYLPIDPGYPAERIQYMLADSGTRLILTLKKYAGIAGGVDEVYFEDSKPLPEAIRPEEAGRASPVNQPDDPAYIIYTSGTTGRPKGVLVEHRAIVSAICWRRDEYRLGSDDSILQLFSPAFDGFLTSFFTPLVSGCRVVMLPDDQASDPRAIVQSIVRDKITHFISVPTLFSAVLDQISVQAFRGVNVVTLAGEAVPAELVKKSKEKNRNVELVNEYGPTEAAVVATFYRDLQPDQKILIGKPAANTQIYILDMENNLLPVGVAGELWIGGEKLAREYINNPDLTAERFKADPFIPGGRMYQTGDRARWLPDGNIEYLGRQDHQVKIRGYRIEPGEIETRLLKLEGVREALVTAGKESDGSCCLYAYIAPAEGCRLPRLREQLARVLPNYMMPAHFIPLDHLPLTANGKIDRQALPQPTGRMDTGAAYQPPENEAERILVRIWQEVLGRERIGVQDSFLSLGGHSLKAAVIASRIRQELGADLPLKMLFMKPTIRELSDVIAGLNLQHYTDIAPAEAMEYYPVSSAQKRLYILSKLDNQGIAYNMPVALQLIGELNREDVARACSALIHRHEALRTSFQVIDSEPVQKVHPQAEFALESREITADSIHACIHEFIRPFDPEKVPLFRGVLIKVRETEHILVFDLHHLVSDGVSVNILLKEFSALYQGKMLPPPRIHYKDYAVWQKTRQEQEKNKGDSAYWQKALAGELPVLNLPLDYPRPPVQDFAGDRVNRMLSQNIVSQMHAFAEETGATVFMILLAAFNALLMRYTEQEDILIGSPVSVRPHTDLENMVGLFANTLVFRNRPETGMSFKELVNSVKENAWQAYEHQEFPFEELIRLLDLKRDISRNPVFDVMLILHNTGMEEIDDADLAGQLYELETKTAKFDLALSVLERKDGLYLSLEYAVRLFKPATVQRLLMHFSRILKQGLQTPSVLLGDMALLTEAEKQQQLCEFNRAETLPLQETLHGLFKQQAAQTPDAPAVIAGDRRLTYEALDRQTDRLAYILQKQGIQPGDAVGLLVEHSLEAVAGILGILKSGGAYLPLDPGYPSERIRYMLADSDVKLLVTCEKLAARFEGIPAVCLDDKRLSVKKTGRINRSSRPEDPAYIIYTSGSTGRPKGVVVGHQAITAAIVWRRDEYRLGREDRVLQLFSPVFDGFLTSFFTPLLSGSPSVFPGEEAVKNPQALRDTIVHNGITHFISVPTLYAVLLDSLTAEDMAGLKIVTLAGEAVPLELVKKSKSKLPGLELINEYGPTEGAVVAACFRDLTPDEKILIGKPVAHTRIYILDQRQNLLPVGMTGELCIGGDKLARCYVNQPELTAERFIPDPFVQAGRMYRTGDLARWQPDGNLEFIGRRDDQVKIRGYRIELGEIEARLLEIDGIREAAVAVGQENTLTAFIAASKEWEAGELREKLSGILPDYMIPSLFIRLGHLPVTANGKLDRKALAASARSAELPKKAGRDFECPVEEMEKRLADIWQEVLSSPPPGLWDNFFELGGDSIKAMQVAAKLNKQGLQMEIKDLFAHPRLQELVKYIRPDTRKIKQDTIEGEIPLSPIQRWFFAQSAADDQHFNQTVLLHAGEGLSENWVKEAFTAIVSHHDALRMIYRKENGRIIQYNRGTAGKLFDFAVFDFTGEQKYAEKVEAACSRIQSRLNLSEGPLVKLGLFKTPQGDHLLIVIHHLVVDGVSWRILLEDLALGYRQASQGKKVSLPEKTHSYREWVSGLLRYSAGEELLKEMEYWRDLERAVALYYGDENGGNDDPSGGRGHLLENGTFTLELNEAVTGKLLTDAHRAYQTEIQELLLTALGSAFAEAMGKEPVLLALEGHGREAIETGLNINRTVGWFTAEYPFFLDVRQSADLGTRIKTVKESLRNVPRKGIGFGILKYMAGHKFALRPEVGFNYLGQFAGMKSGGSNGGWGRSKLNPGESVSRRAKCDHGIDISGIIFENKLVFTIRYDPALYPQAVMADLAECYREKLQEIIEYCLTRQGTELTPSDLSSRAMSLDEINEVYSILSKERGLDEYE